MKKLQWYFPDSIEEALTLLKGEKTVPHSGGTSLANRGLSSVSALVDTARLPLKYLRIDSGNLEIGANETYASVADGLRNILPGNLLIESLGHAASTPLRNRITLGGSASLFPLWSDLLGPMAVLNGEIRAEGKNGGSYDVFAWIRDHSLQRETLITSLFFPDAADWISCYYRETRVGFDYPSFTVSVLARINGKTIDTVRIALSGGLDRVVRLKALEEALTGRDVFHLSSVDVLSMASAPFGRKPSGSPQYLSAVAAVQVKRCLETVLLQEERR